MAAVIGYERMSRRRRFWRGVLVGLVAAGTMAMCMAPPAVRAQADLGPAFAAVTGADGATVTLHLGRGVCVGKARMAVWASPDRQATVHGCWVLAEGVVLVSFLDGERGNIPVGHLVKAATL